MLAKVCYVFFVKLKGKQRHPQNKTLCGFTSNITSTHKNHFSLLGGESKTIFVNINNVKTN
jgi:hypothetical protein